MKILYRHDHPINDTLTIRLRQKYYQNNSTIAMIYRFYFFYQYCNKIYNNNYFKFEFLRILNYKLHLFL